MQQGYDSRVTCETHSDRSRASQSPRSVETSARLWNADAGAALRRTLKAPPGRPDPQEDAGVTALGAPVGRAPARLGDTLPGRATRNAHLERVDRRLFLTGVITGALGAVGVALLLGGVARRRHRRKAASTP